MMPLTTLTDSMYNFLLKKINYILNQGTYKGRFSKTVLLCTDPTNNVNLVQGRYTFPQKKIYSCTGEMYGLQSNIILLIS